MNISVQKDQYIFASAFVILFISWVYFFIGLQTDHVFFAAFIGLGSLLSRRIFRIILGFSAFIIFTIIYDGLQVYPNYEVNPVHIGDLYKLEVSLFGYPYNGETISLNEYFQQNTDDFLSFILGSAYLMWIPGPLIFSAILYARDKKLLLRYSYCFLFVNLLGIAGYYLYPAAPPWYFFEYGDILRTDLRGDPGLLTEFDRIVGFSIFDTIYNRGANVFAAVPSLHCAFPLISLYYALLWRHRPSIVAFVLLTFGTWIAAVYSQHHYVIDVILGIMTAILAIVLFEYVGAKKLFYPLTKRIAAKIMEAPISKVA